MVDVFSLQRAAREGRLESMELSPFQSLRCSRERLSLARLHIVERKEAPILAHTSAIKPPTVPPAIAPIFADFDAATTVPGWATPALPVEDRQLVLDQLYTDNGAD
jgi:hypothetical protein